MTLRVLRFLAHGARLILQTLLALIIVFEEWGWRPLAAALARLSRLKPIAWLEAHIQRLPPYGALVIFAMPSILILPLKLIALYLITAGQEVAAATAEQASGVQQMHQAMGQVDQVTQANAAATEVFASTAEELSRQARQMEAQMAAFKLAGVSA